MEKKQKGRPAKNEKIVRRSHFSIWATKEEKELLNQHIERSGLSASQYFLTLALNSPIKRPQKKSLPARTAETILILERLSGILSLAVLKTRDSDMLSQRWQDSSKNVRMLSDLITKWVFEDFEIWTIRKSLSDIEEWMQQLEMYLGKVLPESENKASVLEKTADILKVSKELLEKYEGYYLTEEAVHTLKAWKHTRLENPQLVHEAVNQSMQELLKNRQS
ncbi:plasmid mobilization protein [Dyadobacter frigoris]|uniref:Uncharacterized protein n=1 Tax=Dyadobacter frigoris TaxID=2576211 RepID=A0A4U6DAY1_9BACT|nr:hypothetical protein [Dyadobacter frigoris]TKT93358.1 hypothetical protein FDK13_05770 [Dyadobacter frigoris]GLU54670.1 hypothetical protein Dfri01_41310 [Dyadobacter frigoris]